jgi:hypothetical protein
MPIVLTCPCGRRLQIRDEYAGQEGKCPACGRTFDIPAPSEDETAPFSLEPVRKPEPEPEVPEVQEVQEAEAYREPERRARDRDEAVRRAAQQAQAPPRQAAAQGPLRQDDGGPVPNHGGEQLPADVDFFAPPPQEIGALVTAYSTLRQPVQPKTAGTRAAIAGGVALVCAAIVLMIVAAAQPREKFFFVFWPVVVGGLAALIAILATRFKHRCTYVGREGLARFQCAGDRDRVSMPEFFLFRDAAEVRTGQTRRYVNGVYQGTDFTFTWSDVAGRTRHVIRGTYKAEKGNPGSTDPYHFGRSAEIAFTMSLLPEVFRRLDMGGDVRFNVSGGRYVRLGPGYMIIQAGSQEEQWDARDINGVQVHQGVVYIRRRDAKEGWFSSKGVFKFDFAALANAQLFIYLVEKVVGVPVG